MDYPVNRSRLQNFVAEYPIMLEKDIIDEAIIYITNKIFDMAGTSKHTRLFINFREFEHLHKGRKKARPITELMVEILHVVQGRFPDTTITMDDMQKYLTVDWS